MHGQRYKRQHDEAEDKRICDGVENTPGRADARVDGLFNGVCRRVVSGERPLGLEQSNHEGQPIGLSGKRLTHVVQIADGLKVVLGEERQAHHQHQDHGDVVPGREVVEPSDDPNADMIENAVKHENDAKHNERRRQVGGVAEEGGQERIGKERTRVVDAGHNADLANQVDPRGVPPPTPATENGGPVVERACGGNGGCEFCQGRGNEQHEERDEGPAEAHHAWPAEQQAVPVQRHGAGEDGNDGKRDGEIGEPTHVP